MKFSRIFNILNSLVQEIYTIKKYTLAIMYFKHLKNISIDFI